MRRRASTKDEEKEERVGEEWCTRVAREDVGGGKKMKETSKGRFYDK